MAGLNDKTGSANRNAETGFLIDECLSPSLVNVANTRGFVAYHVAHRGWGSLKDRQLLRKLIEEELILVTNNRDDFLSLICGVELHPGIVVIVQNVRRDRQIALFEEAIDAMSGMPSMINKVLEIYDDGTITVYDLPLIK